MARIVLAAGRLSPEKGFDVLIEAAASICRENIGVVIFGEGAMRASLECLVAERGLTGRVVLPGFRADLDSLIGAADVVVLSSHTEGLPNIAPGSERGRRAGGCDGGRRNARGRRRW